MKNKKLKILPGLGAMADLFLISLAGLMIGGSLLVS